MSDPDEQHKDNVKCEHEGWQDIKDKKRGCTDCLLLIILAAAWLAMTLVGFVACGVIEDSHLQKGNPMRLTNAIDYTGHICGYNGDVKNKPYGYYLLDKTAVCVAGCPKADNYEKFVCHYDLQAAASADNSSRTGYEYVSQKRCMYEIKTKVFLNRCIPDVLVSAAASAAAEAAASANVTISSEDTYQTSNSNGSGWFSSFLGDVLQMDGYIFGFGLGVSTAIAFLYLYLLRIPGLLFVLIWSIILSVFVLLLVGSWLLWSLADSWKHDGDHSHPEYTTMKVFAYIGMGATVLYFCLIVVMRKRVQLAIGIVKQASKALATMPALLALPVIQAVGLTAFLVPWIIYVLYLASSGDVHTEVGHYTLSDGTDMSYNYRTFTYTTNTKYAFLYMLFCWFWTSEFIVAIGQLVISLSFTAWYFTRDKKSIGQGTVIWAFKTVGWYHLGTAAFGSLIIAIIKTIRAVIAYIQRKAKKSGNKVLQYVMCILQCCMWCLEKIMKFINKHAYILTSIYGYSFCKAARKAFFLLLRNILRVAAVNMVATFLLLIGKIFVPVLTVFLCYLLMAYSLDSASISGIIAPLVFTFLLAYWVSSMFSEIFAMGIETILFCYIADEEMFKVEDRFADGELQSTIQKTAQAAAAAKKARIQVQVHPKAEEIVDPKKDGGGTPAVAHVVSPPGDALL